MVGVKLEREANISEETKSFKVLLLPVKIWKSISDETPEDWPGLLQLLK